MSYKEEMIDKLSKIENLVFVGGTSEYIQGVKDKLNDIDIVVLNIEDLENFGYIHKFELDLFYGLSGNRGVILKKDLLIDIFIEKKLPYYTIINGKKCQTIDSMIELREKTLKFSSLKIKNIKDKIKFNLNRLIEWKQLQL